MVLTVLTIPPDRYPLIDQQVICDISRRFHVFGKRLVVGDKQLNKGTDPPEALEAHETEPQSLALTINKATNEIIFTDPTGRVFVLQPKVIDAEEPAPKIRKPI